MYMGVENSKDAGVHVRVKFGKDTTGRSLVRVNISIVICKRMLKRNGA
jgi:hypothetical protein